MARFRLFWMISVALVGDAFEQGPGGARQREHVSPGVVEVIGVAILAKADILVAMHGLIRAV